MTPSNATWHIQDNVVYKIVDGNSIQSTIEFGYRGDNTSFVCKEAEAMHELLTSNNVYSMVELLSKLKKTELFQPVTTSKQTILDVDRVGAVKLRVKGHVGFELDSYLDVGMLCWLTKVDYHYDHDRSPDYYVLHLDCTDFMDHNEKYLTECYYPNSVSGYEKEKYTAKEAGYYTQKITLYFVSILPTPKSVTENELDIARLFEIIE